MGKTGTAHLPLHGGTAPRWLFDRMEELGGAISRVIIDEYGRNELLQRLGDPYWFQAFGCVLGFDWHSSGLTTTTMGALKEALDAERDGVAIVGGKGATSRNTPQELVALEEPFNLTSSAVERLQHSSRMSAAADNNCVQDTYTLYHHTMVVTEDGDWTVVQQGMNDEMARRYHWREDTVDSYVEDPQQAICSMEQRDRTLNLTSGDADETRDVSVDLVQDDPAHLERYLNPGQSSLDRFVGGTDAPRLSLPMHHRLRQADLSQRTIDQLQHAYEVQPDDFEELVGVDGIGGRSLRALAMIAEIVHGTENDWRDPAKYSYAHGGKDGTPYPVDRERYDESIDHVQQALHQADVEGKEKRKALERLSTLAAG